MLYVSRIRIQKLYGHFDMINPTQGVTMYHFKGED